MAIHGISATQDNKEIRLICHGPLAQVVATVKADYDGTRNGLLRACNMMADQLCILAPGVALRLNAQYAKP